MVSSRQISQEYSKHQKSEEVPGLTIMVLTRLLLPTNSMGGIYASEEIHLETPPHHRLNADDHSHGSADEKRDHTSPASIHHDYTPLSSKGATETIL